MCDQTGTPSGAAHNGRRGLALARRFWPCTMHCAPTHMLTAGAVAAAPESTADTPAVKSDPPSRPAGPVSGRGRAASNGAAGWADVDSVHEGWEAEPAAGTEAESGQAGRIIGVPAAVWVEIDSVQLHRSRPHRIAGDGRKCSPPAELTDYYMSSAQPGIPPAHLLSSKLPCPCLQATSCSPLCCWRSVSWRTSFSDSWVRIAATISH